MQYSTHRRGQDRKIFVCTLLQELEILIWMTAGAGDGHGLVNAHGNDDSGLFQGCYIYIGYQIKKYTLLIKYSMKDYMRNGYVQ